MKRFVMTLVAIMGFGALVLAAPTVGAMTATEKACVDVPSDPICRQGSNNDFGSIIKIIINTLLFLVGAVSVVMVIVGGIMYTTSAGDSGQVTKAKNTLLYALVGLVIAFLAYAIVNWVVKKF